MRKKKEKHELPVHSKKNKLVKSCSKNSILHHHDNKLQNFESQKNKLKQMKTSVKDSKKLQKINDDIKKIESDEVEYLLSTSLIINKYLELDELNNNSTNDKEIYDIYTQKNQLCDEYMKIIDPNYVNSNKSDENFVSKDEIICNKCNLFLEIDDGFNVCLNCGFSIKIVDNTTEPSYKEMQDYIFKPQFTYQKESHLDDWIRRFQSKENRIIDQVILDKVILEAKKQRITDLNTLTEDKVKKYLKNLNLNDYYDNVIAIINRINGRPPFILTTEIEEKIKRMFRQIQEPFVLYKPPTRKNFLSYSYILHQFFKILGLHEFTKYFPLLKSTDKLRQQDEIFKKIVEHMYQIDTSVNWVFYPTV